MVPGGDGATGGPIESTVPPENDPEAVRAVVLSKGWDEERLQRVLKDSGYRLYEVVRELARGRPVYELNANRVVSRDSGAFQHLLNAVARARVSLKRRPARNRDA